jgi:hypothetical protein
MLAATGIAFICKLKHVFRRKKHGVLCSKKFIKLND